MARPRLKLDEDLIYELAKIQCTYEEIAACCKCSVDTLERRCADVIKKAQEEGKSSLRRLQWALAKKGNVAMQIWLGKQWLGQSDKTEVGEAGTFAPRFRIERAAKQQYRQRLERKLAKANGHDED